MVSRLRDVRLSTVVIATALITLLFLPLTVGTNNNALLQSKSVFAQEEEEGEVAGTTNTTAIANDTTTEPTDFLPYSNPLMGIFIQYPSNWTASTSGLVDYADVIAFYSPLQNLSDLFPARLKISVPVYNQNVSVPEYTNFVMTILNQSEQIDVRNSSEFTVAGYPGYRVVLANQPFQNSTLILYQMNTWTTIGNKLYLLSYEGEESAFNRHLPEVNRMLESLSIEK